MKPDYEKREKIVTITILFIIFCLVLFTVPWLAVIFLISFIITWYTSDPKGD